MFPWHDDRRFNSYSSYISREFGSRVQKISIDAGFSCPNRDGTISTGGCTFCRNDAFNPSSGSGLQVYAMKSSGRDLQVGVTACRVGALSTP